MFGCEYQLAGLPGESVLVDHLKSAIRLYRTLILYGGGTILSEDEAAEAGLDTASIEEKRQYVAHRKIERNRKTSKKVKRVHGYICQACSCDFGLIYGEAASGYIEAHHLVPLSELPEGQPVRLDPQRDFAVLCANCHRTIHKKGVPKTVAELRSLPMVAKLRDWIEANRKAYDGS